MALEHFLATRDGQRLPLFLQARRLPVAVVGEPWAEHARAVEVLRLQDQRAGSPLVSPSLLDLKIQLAEQALESCDLCPHHCRVNRNAGGTGYCGVAAQTAVHWEGILLGEELEVIPSHEVFLSGCTMRCAFCYSHEHITRPMSGQTMAPAELARCVSARWQEGSTNLNLVGGEPTVHLPNILKTLRLLQEPAPIVWNSNMYANAEAMALLDGVVDLFLGDIHFGNPDCAERLGRIPDYLASVQNAFRLAWRSGASVIIRHLLMPGHLDCCAAPAMAWAARELPEVPFHLMFQYVPDFRAEQDPVLNRRLTPEEVLRAQGLAREIGVQLYDEGNADLRGAACRNSDGSSPTVGATVDILVHGDGRVSFTRLLPDLAPVAAALDATDPRTQRRREPGPAIHRNTRRPQVGC